MNPEPWKTSSLLVIVRDCFFQEFRFSFSTYVMGLVWDETALTLVQKYIILLFHPEGFYLNVYYFQVFFQ